MHPVSVEAQDVTRFEPHTLVAAAGSDPEAVGRSHLEDPLTPNAPDAFTLPITELGDEIVGGDGADTTELHAEQRPRAANPIAGPAQAILDRRATRETNALTAAAVAEFDSMSGPRPMRACALFYTQEDVTSALAASDFTPPTTPYLVYIGSGERRPGDFGQQVSALAADTPVVHVVL